MVSKKDIENVPQMKKIKLLPYCGTPSRNHSGACHIPHMLATAMVALRGDMPWSNFGRRTPRHPTSSEPPPIIMTGRISIPAQMLFCRNGPDLPKHIELNSHENPLIKTGTAMIPVYHNRFTLYLIVSAFRTDLKGLSFLVEIIAAIEGQRPPARYKLINSKLPNFVS